MHYLGIDFGLKRVGLASSEGTLASPLKTLEVKNSKDTIEKVVQEVKAGNFDKVVIGLPEGKMGQTVSGFIKALRKMGLDVVDTDETLSSQEALKQMIELGISKKERSTSDAYSAAIILQNYMDTQ